MTAPKLRPAEEIAREMVPEPAPDAECGYIATLAVADDGSRLILRACWSDAGARRERDAAVAFATEVIERARADGAAAALAAQQPRDLAGRIRGLVQEYAGRMVDEESAALGSAYEEVISSLRECIAGVRAGVPGTAQACVDALRREFDLSSAGLGEPLWQAADELEAIVRECAKDQQ